MARYPPAPPIRVLFKFQSFARSHTHIYICIYICIYSWGILIDHEYENGRGYKFHFKRHGPPRVVSRNALSLTISIRRREI